MSKPLFSEDAWNDYMYWLSQDRKTISKINTLIKDIMRNGTSKGLGKPEILKGDMSGYYSRRINEQDRLIYRLIDGDIIEIVSCKGHYE
ncbi:MAG: Txe/YoeB family addiction module toxin [Synergistaceae bacterium]|nr:Txe/YoeB family addiction module toxin [Synergistaceae bacterium]